MTRPVPEAVAPRPTSAQLAARARAHLEAVVRIDSSSDAGSEAIPSTPGQVELAAWLEAFFTARGAEVERDGYANTIATLPGRGALASAPPLALLIHLDTAQGTHAVDGLCVCEGWDGRARIPYPRNADLQVTVEHYPALARFVGHDLVHGPGDAPFGLDDKLGLAHMMTLAWLLETHPEAAHPPLLLIARPDEEIGRMEALEGLAVLLASRGVRRGYTIDGIEPFEVNVENFNAAQVSVRFPHRPLERALVGGALWEVELRGVNTHGATAYAERHRPATRLAVEVLAWLDARERAGGVEVLDMACDVERDCDARLVVWLEGEASAEALREALGAVVGPFVPLGAGWALGRIDGAEEALPSAAAQDALALVGAFLGSAPGFVLSAEESYGRMGYSQPYRIVPDGDGLRLDIRLRDFDPEGLDARRAHALEVAAASGLDAVARDQYVNMGPRLEGDALLVAWPQAAAEAALGVAAPVLPIRGGTGVDPFLDQGIAIANLGTGYFAPESEKEFTSLQLMADHARWLFALVQRADGRPA